MENSYLWEPNKICGRQPSPVMLTVASRWQHMLTLPALNWRPCNQLVGYKTENLRQFQRLDRDGWRPIALVFTGKCPKVLRANVMFRYGLAACPADLVSQPF